MSSSSFGRRSDDEDDETDEDEDEIDPQVHIEVRRWDFLDILFTKTWKIMGKEFSYFYLTPGRKLLFIDETAAPGDQIRGCYMQLYRFDHQGMEELCDETELVRVSKYVFQQYASEITADKLREYAERHNMPVHKKRTKIFAIKWRKMFSDLKERNGIRIFEFDGHSRHQILTTGSIWGNWK